MEVIILLIGASIVVAGGFLWAFVWSVRSGQFDDDFTPKFRILYDDEKPASNKEIKSKTKK